MNSLDFILNNNDCDAYKMHALSLAFLGDAIHSLYVRNNLIKSSDYKQKELQSITASIVCAKNQSKALDIILNSLTEEEMDIYKRARNAKTNNIAKNTSIEDYKKSTAFEALLAFEYLTSNTENLKKFLLVADDCAKKNM